jgi:hypothetical protein
MRVRVLGVIPVLALGALAGCSADTSTPPPGVEADSALADTAAKDSTLPDTGGADTEMEDTSMPEDSGATDSVAADTSDSAAADSAVAADTADTADSAVAADTADSAMATDTADSATADDVAVADAADAASDTPSDSGAPFVPTEVWVTRVGDGSGALNNASTAVFIEKRSIATGSLVGTAIAMPVAASGSNHPLTYSGSATSEGALSRSGNGKYVTLGGYATAPGVTSIANTTTSGDAGTAVLRVVGRVDAAGNVDTSTTTTSHSGNNIRGAASFDGTQYWTFGGNDGVVYLTHGTSAMAGTPISTGITNVRVATMFEDASLWGSTSSGSTYRVFNFGTAPRPTTATTPVAPTGIPTTGGSPYGIAGIATGTTSDIDTVYVCDDGTTAGGIYRYKAVGGTYGAPVRLTTVGCRGLAVWKSGLTVTIVAVTAENPSRVVSVADTTVGLTSGTLVPLATAGMNTQFRGVAFAPEP